MDLPYYVYSNHYEMWFCPEDRDERAQFVIHDAKLKCFIWDKYDIVEIIEDLIPASVLLKTEGDPLKDLLKDPEYNFA